MLLFEFESYLKNLSKEEFVNEVLVRLNAKYVIVGEDYRFGKDAEGSALELKNLCEAKNIRVEIIKTLSMDGKKISSSRIAEFLNVGDIPSINKMLGSHYKIMGKVTVGLRNGAKIGFPTANINVSDDLLIPKNGVYATDIIIRGKRYRSMTNIGVHPTIAELIMPIPEVHIFDFSEDIYGLTVSLEFLSFIREEQRFNSLSELVKQLTLDRETAKNFREKRILK